MFLKIVSGSRAGVEIPLAHGSYVLGTKDHCDFLIGDQEGSGISALLTVSEAGAALTASGDDASGRLMPAGTVRVIPGESFCIGHTELLVTLAVPDDDAQEECAEEFQEVHPASEAILADSPGAGNPETGTASQHDDHPVSPKKTGLPWILAIGLGCVIISAAAFAAFSPKAAPPALQQQEKGEAQQALLQGISHLVTPIEKHGKTQLLAYFSSEEQRREIKDRIAALGLDATYQLEFHAEETLLAELRQYLAGQGLDLTPRLNGPGRVQLIGLLPPEYALESIETGLTSTFDAVAHVDYAVSPDAEVLRLVRQMAKEQAIDLVSLAPAPDTGSVAVVTGSACVNMLRNKLQSHAYASRAVFRLGLVSDDAATARRDAESIRKITLKPYRFAVLADGQVVFEGGKIGDTPVKKIRSDGVEMSSGAVLKTVDMRSPGTPCEGY